MQSKVIDDTFSKMLLNIRESMQLTQKECADKLKVSRSTVARIENKTKFPCVKTQGKIKALLKEIG